MRTQSELLERLGVKILGCTVHVRNGCFVVLDFTHATFRVAYSKLPHENILGAEYGMQIVWITVPGGESISIAPMIITLTRSGSVLSRTAAHFIVERRRHLGSIELLMSNEYKVIASSCASRYSIRSW